MNFNYSYRAFLISCLLVGNLVLLLVSVRLSGPAPDEEVVTAVEYQEYFPEETTVIDVSERVEIQTNRAYNEAERFITEIENSRNEATNNSEENQEETTTEDLSLSESIALNDAQQRLEEVKRKLSENADKTGTRTEEEGVNRKTTISYFLKDRQAMRLRNPVYTCQASGRIVINIEVSDQGKVVKASFHKDGSSTTNGCLIDSALHYAKLARFSTAAGTARQSGTITYVFPGQY